MVWRVLELLFYTGSWKGVIMAKRRKVFTFSHVCENCGRSFFRARGHGGGTDKYCDDCGPEIRRRKVRDNVRAYRERRRQENLFGYHRGFVSGADLARSWRGAAVRPTTTRVTSGRKGYAK